MSGSDYAGFSVGDPEEADPGWVDDPVLQLENLSVEFNMDRGVARVVEDVTIDIQRGETIGFVGESGSGKSMLAASLLDAVIDPGRLTGDITYHTADGRAIDVLDLPAGELKRFRWEAVSMVFQGAMNSFNPVMTIREHFHDTLDAHNAHDEETMQRGYDLLEDLYLDPDRVLDVYPHELSGGQKQRALIALALILQPKVLVMDEPTSALDLLMQRSIIALLTELKSKYEFTLVFITHDLPLVKDLCDRLAVMYAFQVAEVGPTREVLGGAYHPYTRALLNASSSVDTPIDDIVPIPGQSPDPVNVPEGCSYHPRCPLAAERCRQEDPNLVEVDTDHRAACFYWDDVEESIPLAIPGAHRGGRDE